MPGVLERVKHGEAVQSFEISRAGKDGKPIHMSLTVSPVCDSEHTLIAASTVARDVSERVRAEQQRALLMGELDHRVKNTLTTVLAIARQSAKNSASVAEFSEAFQARLMALAQTQSSQPRTLGGRFLAQNPGGRAFAIYPGGRESRFSLHGEDIRLTPGQAVTLGMAFHELAANAAKDGAYPLPLDGLMSPGASKTPPTESGSGLNG